MSKRFIVVGCSHSANSGFDKNIDKHYVNLLRKQTDCEIINLSIGGMSNDEVFQRTVEFISTNQNKPDDIFIIQWSCVDRLWVYESANNVDDFMQIIPVARGLGDLNAATQYHKIHTTYYANSYMNIKKWFIHMLALQSLLKLHKIQYVYVNGFDNLLTDIDVYRDQEIQNLTETTLNSNLRQILDFDNRTDDYIIKKLNILLKLYNQLDFSNCLKFGSFYFGKNKLDFADDNAHWGIKENALWVKEIFEHLKNNNIAV